MSFPTIPITAPGTSQPVRGLAWSVKQTDQWSTIVQRSDSGRTIRIPRWTNPLWLWEFTWDFISDGWAGLAPTIQSGNTPYTDLQVIMGFRQKMQGQGGEFLYVPNDSVQVGALLGNPDVNGFVAVARDLGGFKEAIQYLPSASVSNVKKNGSAAGSVLSPPNTITGYTGYVLNSSGTQWLTTDVITCDFTYNYLCAFVEDVQEWENFMFELWILKSLKFEQIRI